MGLQLFLPAASELLDTKERGLGEPGGPMTYRLQERASGLKGVLFTQRSGVIVTQSGKASRL